jgi:hypothetical protein
MICLQAPYHSSPFQIRKAGMLHVIGCNGSWACEIMVALRTNGNKISHDDEIEKGVQLIS